MNAFSGYIPQLNWRAHKQYHHICTLITSLHTVTGYAAEKVQQAARGQGANRGDTYGAI